MEVYHSSVPDTTKEVAQQHQYPSGLEVAPQQTPAWDPNYGQPVYGPQERTILGLRRTTFILTAALIVVIIAAAVGGGVGGSLAVQNARSSSSAALQGNVTTRTVTVTVAAASQTGGTTTGSGLVVPTGTLALDCPGLDTQGQQLITLGTRTWRFTPKCGTDYGGYDIGAVIVYSFHDCLQACAAHNFFYGVDQCVAVHFTANMASAIADNYGDCWLKNGTSSPATGQGNSVVSAILASSG